MVVRSTVLLALLALVVGAGGSAAGSAAGACPKGVVCSRVEVPLDPAGKVPGKVSLFVERLHAIGPPRGQLFLIAGGPGQSAVQAFDLAGTAFLYQALFPGYDLVVFDSRGTGRSGELRCPSLAAPSTTEGQAESQVASCASHLGARRNLYSTAVNVADIDAVRAQLGLNRIALWGVSYGTKVALAYAQEHPRHVSRLLLDSIVPPGKTDLFGTSTLQAIAPNLSHYCAAFDCASSTPNAGADLVALANHLAAHPLHVTLRQHGKAYHVSVGGLAVLSIVVQADLDPALAAELPAVVHSARLGKTAPLLRLIRIMGASGADEGISDALYLATTCSDAKLPWSAGAGTAARAAALRTAIRRLPASELGGFGRWAAQLGNAETCRGWPSSSPEVKPAATRYPDVPVLALSGSFDMRAPTAQARKVVAQFPHGRLLVVNGTGHSVITSAPTPCLFGAIHHWLDGAAIASSCGSAFELKPLPAFPTQQRPPHAYTPSRTLALAGTTLQEAETTWLMLVFENEIAKSVSGLDGGTLAGTERKLKLNHYSITPGIELTATLSANIGLGKVSFSGPVKITGADAAAGTLNASEAGLSGKLSSQSVHSAPGAMMSGLAGNALPAVSTLARG